MKQAKDAHSYAPQPVPMRDIPNVSPVRPYYSNVDKVNMRIGILDGLRIVEAISLKDKVAVVVDRRNEELLIVNDDRDMFPSDALVTKLRLLSE